MMSVNRTNFLNLVKKSHNSCLLGGICVLALLMSAGIVEAQTKIEQMIVTAHKRAQDIQTVPASISAFSGEGLENRQIKNISDLGRSTPNVNFAMTSSNVPLLSIRGVSPDIGSPLLDQTVALHIDGIYQPRSNNLDLILADLDNVEILRGPQGTLYGRNANAGVNKSEHGQAIGCL